MSTRHKDGNVSQDRKVLRITLGIIFIVLGLLGLVFPILQGWLFLAVGALLLSRYVPFFERIISWIRNRFPRIGRKAEKIQEEWSKDHEP
jgi:uncharacterized membrane protein YbaN (DUF454 family)